MPTRLRKTTKTPTDRSAIMRAVHSRDTKPELRVRNWAWSIRRGYRLHRKDIPGNPDIAYIGRRQAIFVHGCFWHGHDCARGSRIPKANREYWLDKIARNRSRDVKSLASLDVDGWRVLVLWECELKDEISSIARLRNFLLA